MNGRSSFDDVAMLHSQLSVFALSKIKPGVAKDVRIEKYEKIISVKAYSKEYFRALLALTKYEGEKESALKKLQDAFEASSSEKPGFFLIDAEDKLWLLEVLRVLAENGIREAQQLIRSAFDNWRDLVDDRLSAQQGKAAFDSLNPAPEVEAAYAFACLCDQENRDSESLAWLTKAAKRYHPLALCALAQHYGEGKKGLPNDREMANRFLDLIAQSDDEAAKIWMGCYITQLNSGSKTPLSSFPEPWKKSLTANLSSAFSPQESPPPSAPASPDCKHLERTVTAHSFLSLPTLPTALPPVVDTRRSEIKEVLRRIDAYKTTLEVAMKVKLGLCSCAGRQKNQAREAQHKIHRICQMLLETHTDALDAQQIDHLCKGVILTGDAKDLIDELKSTVAAAHKNCSNTISV